MPHSGRYLHMENPNEILSLLWGVGLFGGNGTAWIHEEQSTILLF